MQDVWKENHKYLKPSISHHSCCCSKHVMLIAHGDAICVIHSVIQLLLRKVYLLQDLFSKATDLKIFKYGIMIKAEAFFYKLNTSYWETANQHEVCGGYLTGYPHDLPALSPSGSLPCLISVADKGNFYRSKKQLHKRWLSWRSWVASGVCSKTHVSDRAKDSGSSAQMKNTDDLESLCEKNYPNQILFSNSGIKVSLLGKRGKDHCFGWSLLPMSFTLRFPLCQNLILAHKASVTLDLGL